MHTLQLNLFLIFAVNLVLAACSSGGGGNGLPEGNTDLYNEVTSLFNNNELIVPETLQGKATMEGMFLTYLSTTETHFVGGARATADFDEGRLVGQVGNVGEYADLRLAPESTTENRIIIGDHVQDFSGTLDVEADITGDDFSGTLVGDLSGHVDALGGKATISYDAPMYGKFRELQDGRMIASGISRSIVTLSNRNGEITDGYDSNFMVVEVDE